jgi:S-sulfo-L-cysteine synthase (3-phospho-L-serine-dependent)
VRLRGVFPDVGAAIELPDLVRLQPNLIAARFALMKMLPARFMLERARDDGRLGPETTIVETTSGTFGLALAIVAAVRRYSLVLVSDPVVDPALRRRLEELGARVEIVERPAAEGGFQRARLDRLLELQATLESTFWPNQYDNPHNAGAYAPFAELVAESVGRVDWLVGTVGSGGSTCGTCRHLRRLFPELRAAAVDTHGSVLFGQPDRKRALRGLGNSLMPRNIDHTTFDEVHWVSAPEAFAATRELQARHGIYAGPTSGAAYLVACWLAEREPEARIVVVFPDEGHRYETTVFDDGWLRENDLVGSVPHAPVDVDAPEPAEWWTRLVWGRRTHADVIGASESEAPRKECREPAGVR